MRLIWRRARRWLKWIIASWAGLVLLSLLLANSNVPADQRDEWLGKRVLLVTAHPDDEVLFFAPSILAMISMGVQIYALCLSIGNADNLGMVREQELVKSYATLGVPADLVKSVDDPLLQDGMDKDWSIESITDQIKEQELSNGPFDAIITFDENGVSRHPNHIACYRAVKHLSQFSTLRPTTSFYVLHTVPIYVKFLSLPMAIARQFLSADPTHRLRFFSSINGYLRALRAMSAHASQLVWFRYLYITASVYMYNNELIKF